jgi:N-acetylmuramoyl-L-alanine amidase
MLRIFKIILAALAALLIGWIFHTAITYKLDKLKTAEAMKRSPVTAELREYQLECLARNIYYEAGNEPFEGKVAVAQVTLNRAASEQFPNDICKVIYQKNVVYNKVICQFSWYCEKPAKLKPRDSKVYQDSMVAAKKVLLEGFRLPSLESALYYHADYVNPKWGKQQVAKIGRHIFYK